MSYVKQNFVDGQTLTAAQLNHMEAGIANAAGTQGEKGDKGEKGDPGPAGAKGDPGEGFTANAKALLLNLFENAAYKTDTMQPTLNALRAEWGGSAQEVPVQSVSLSAVTMTLNESESKTLTATVLPANATDRAVVWSVLPTGFATVTNGVVTGTADLQSARRDRADPGTGHRPEAAGARLHRDAAIHDPSGCESGGRL